MGINDNKSPWARVKPIDTHEVPSPDEFVDRKFATQYFSQRLPMHYGDVREFRDRLGKKIDTACGNGKLKSSNGKFRFGDLAEWAKSRQDFAVAVKDIAIPATGGAHITMPSINVNASGFSIPHSLPECQIALADAYRELLVTREANHNLRATVAALTPLKTKAEARSKAAKRAGKQGGRGNTK